MDLSYSNRPSVHHQFTFTKRQCGNILPEELQPGDLLNAIAGIIDVSKINFDDDEAWLYKTNLPKTVNDLHSWLYESDLINATEEICHKISNLQLKQDLKNIDTRTFTRPKKRFVRPSIEKYNEEIYGTSELDTELFGSQNELITHLNGVPEEKAELKPLNFDLMQPTNSYYFENILANAKSIDSFQNMSPPSLVNSMCSSTFANLMENSFIKNDPVLREIRDTDYTESILQEPEVFKSFTESYSSMNSDVPEIFLKKHSFSNSFNKKSETNLLESSDDSSMFVDAVNEVVPNNTFQRHSISIVNNEKLTENENLNSTFSKKKISSENEKSTKILNSSHNRDAQLYEKTIEKVLISEDDDEDLVVNKFTDNQNDKTDETKTFKRNSFCGSTSSNDNLDCMSNSSSSSKGENRVLNMDGINAIVEMQERSLQISSTPKFNTFFKRPQLWDNNFISPITGKPNSDPDLSCTDEYKGSTQVINTNTITKPKSLAQVNCGTMKISDLRKLQSIGYHGSQPNLKDSEAFSQTATTHLFKGNNKTSNLNSVGSNLRGSYTSLRPFSANLPVAPPIISKKSNISNSTQVVEPKVLPTPRNDIEKTTSGTFIKTHGMRSGLPRPVGTGIPRPVSRIPGPKNIRSMSNAPTPSTHQSQGKQNLRYF